MNKLEVDDQEHPQVGGAYQRTCVHTGGQRAYEVGGKETWQETGKWDDEWDERKEMNKWSELPRVKGVRGGASAAVMFLLSSLNLLNVTAALPLH